MRYLCLITLLLAGLPLESATGPETVKTFPSNGFLGFEIREMLDHPLYWWPPTLVSYPVRFDGKTVTPERLVLTGENGAPVPFQLSGVKLENGHLRLAIVNFITDLPTGGRRSFKLAMGNPPVATAEVKELREGDAIVLDTGVMKVRLPASRAIQGETPGPIQGVSRGGAWFGKSRLVSPRRRAIDVTATRVESGPLFVTYRISYRFEGGATYAATVRAAAGYDFVSFFEEMEGFAREDGARLETSWTDFHPTHRQAPNHPYYPRMPVNGKKGFARFDFEKIDQNFVNTQHGVSGGANAEGEMPFRLGIYEPWGAYVILNSANFWDERTNDAVGVFIDKTERWEDHDYSIWSASPALQVHYYYKDGVMTWRWPLVTGTRSTGIAAYDHKKDIDAVDQLEESSKPKRHTDGQMYRSEFFPASHALFLQNHFGLLDLNVVKDWVLEYPDTAKRPPVVFKAGRIGTAAELEQTVLRGSSLINGLPVSGTRQNAGYNPVASRTVYENWIDAYNRFYPTMNETQRRRITAWFLMMAYVDGADQMMPMQTMLAGHPNFLSDIKNLPAQMAFLFPEHPMAQEWAGVFGKFVELNTRYHTRPAVTAWDSRGGRWTENLGTYVWAFLRPAIRGSLALEKYFDGKNRFALPQLAQLGDWTVNALSSPFNGEDPKYSIGPDGKFPPHAWGLITPELGPRRLHPPQGAHSARRMAPRSMWLLGDTLRNYEPLVAESLMWAAHPEDDDSEFFKTQLDSWSILYPPKDNRGTNPHLASSKYTGYGITLRSAVDTPDEISIHLQQIDEGPNYRWGMAGEGGSGVLYYYAGGKSYSHNAREDVGDRAAHDTDFCTNFAVWKNGQFRSVGRNVLDRPLYDLGTAQFAEITPREGAGAYSWPEYVGRTVMLAGADYIVTYDQVYNDAVAHRFSWFTQVGDDMPFITMVKGGVSQRQRLQTKVETETTKGVWHDGLGDAMAVVTHKSGVKVEATAYGAKVTQDGVTDQVFRNPEGVDLPAFRGTAGLIRQRANGVWELALFHGSRIAAGGLEMTTEDKNLGISAVLRSADEVAGTYAAVTASKVRIVPVRGNLYVDGERQTVAADGSVVLKAGTHRWQMTAGDPVPNAPRIRRTENVNGGARIVVAQVAGATSYRYEMSRDNGQTWLAATATLQGLTEGTKVHVRAIAVNASRQSAAGPEYPVYVSASAPAAPDGLRLVIADNRVEVIWGEILGASEYRLYRRVKGQGEFKMIYHGVDRHTTDAAAGAIKPFVLPGHEQNALYDGKAFTIYEYAVASVNGNGEGKKSAVCDTDPASWENWDPKPGEAFRRRVVHVTSGNPDLMPTYYPK
jgi:hypothetical protein